MRRSRFSKAVWTRIQESQKRKRAAKGTLIHSSPNRARRDKAGNIIWSNEM
jgi:hypothetical protein